MKWLLLSEAAELVALRVGDKEIARRQILQCLRRGELTATAERFQEYRIHTGAVFDPTSRKHVARASAVKGDYASMVEIGTYWWDICQLDWERSSADRRWSERDYKRVGDKQPVQATVSGVLLDSARINQLWPNRVPAVPKKPNHRPAGTGKQATDKPLVDKMHALIREHQAGSITAAARIVLKDKGGNVDSDVRRLRDRYKTTYGDGE
jgi:hypothetical protein